ncbi:hypothetical protein [Cytobacillus sp. IB215316]|uniref:hypothetical protein n=1 Tax=Cytobacillus sp. IB215316 TaxID=3097354 RepID=UPI002A0AEF43|nr:hypothetical protein [Cytobacillus sp. IB215316]MDX8363481.1 hypothetical protein [Cytobacillus sp. IB215316]
MNRFFILIIAILLVVVPNKTGAMFEGYDLVSESSEDNIALYAKKIGDIYQDFKLDFKGTIYSKPFWLNVDNPTYAPKIFYKDINGDENKELIIILTHGTGSGLLEEEVHVFHAHNNQFYDVLVDNPIAVVLKNVITKLSLEKAEISIGDKKYTIDIKFLEIQPGNLFEDVAFGSIIDYQLKDNQLNAKISGQISPASFVGDIIIVYEYRNKMYQTKSIRFQTPYDYKMSTSIFHNMAQI